MSSERPFDGVTVIDTGTLKGIDNQVDPTTGTGTLVSVPGTAAGDFRLSMTWVDSDTVIGAQGGTAPSSGAQRNSAAWPGSVT